MSHPIFFSLDHLQASFTSKFQVSQMFDCDTYASAMAKTCSRTSDKVSITLFRLHWACRGSTAQTALWVSLRLPATNSVASLFLLLDVPFLSSAYLGTYTFRTRSCDVVLDPYGQGSLTLPQKEPNSHSRSLQRLRCQAIFCRPEIPALDDQLLTSKHRQIRSEIDWASVLESCKAKRTEGR